MSECKEIRRLLALRPDDRSAAGWNRVEAHLTVCAACAALAETYAEQDRVLRDRPWVGLTPSQRGQLLATIGWERRRYKMRTRLFAVLSAAAAVAALIALVLGLKILLPSTGQVMPGRLSDPSTPEISTVDLQEVAFSFDMGRCVHDAGEWDASADLDVSIDKVMVSSTDWKVGERWLVEGHYTLKTGSFDVAIIQDYSGTSRFHTSGGGHTLTPGSGDFRLLYELLEITGTVASEDLTLHVYDSESDDSMRCPIDIHDAISSPQGQFQWPTPRREISGWTFHDPRNPEHVGIDIAAAEGDPVVSVADGVVTFAGWNEDGYGNMVIVEHADGWSSYYAQLDEIAVDVGQGVSQGELLGKAGSTGFSSGPHLHFELHYKGYPADPLDHLPSQHP